MIQAYRRGLLKPELPFGYRSRIREELLLESIEAELTVDAAQKRLGLRASLVGPARLSKEGRISVIQAFSDDLQRLELLRLLDYDQADASSRNNSALAIASVYEMLQQSGALNPGTPTKRQ